MQFYNETVIKAREKQCNEICPNDGDRGKAFSLISSQDHRQKFSPSRISDMQQDLNLRRTLIQALLNEFVQ